MQRKSFGLLASHPYWKNSLKQYQNNTRTSKNYTRTGIKHTGSGMILILVYKTFPIGIALSIEFKKVLKTITNDLSTDILLSDTDQRNIG